MKRLTNAVAKILNDPANRTRTAEEVAEAVIAAAGDLIQADAEKAFTAKQRAAMKAEIHRDMARSHRTVVVGRISLAQDWSTPSKGRTVVLGPFSSRRADTDEKFQEAAQDGSAAKTAGMGLAWDVKTGLGRGRFTTAPVFVRPQDAWNYYRSELAPLREVVEGAFSTRYHADLEPMCHCHIYDPRACPKHGE